MTGRTSHAMTLALQAWPKEAPESRRLDAAINDHARTHGISQSGLYRSLVRNGLIVKKPRKAGKAKRR